VPPNQVAPPPVFHRSPGQVAFLVPVMVDSLPCSVPICPSITGRDQTSSPLLVSRASTRPPMPNSPPDTPVMILPLITMGAAVIE